ncbi:SH3 domain-containing kinase-binding protein 1 isoform X1 [Periophthalmus magnuspinnatus]|uniref:SH3 domain-containing kinase-binding protein 1 isoform X1 n=1 Tax=Periophthalmus magnuspinnatus TaxID=409849 RepID=UPI002436F463|nr:SH3 domain-containing kinase-binding protein 1 isoform X1 [Periophthalmus magnuspinnatus]
MVEAVVEFDYEAQQDDELSLSVGDIIVNIRRDDGGWWEGELHGRRGLFPDNFVREIKKEGKRDGGQASVLKNELSNGRASPVSTDTGVRPGKKVEQIRKRRCKAAFSYAPQHEDELELKIGDIIEIITEVEEGWWEGVLNGKTGMFPSNFTKEIVLDSDTPSIDTSQEDLRSGRTSEKSKDSPGSESDGADSRSDTGSVEIQPKKVRGFGFGNIFKDQPIKLRPRSLEVDTEATKLPEGKAATETMKTEPDCKTRGREQCKVLFPYEAQNEDELSIKEGEVINIITKECADAGWWMGEIGGRQGVFPDNFVKLLLPEVEKERPKKPPPPSAPSSKANTEKKSELKKVPPERPEHLPHREQDRGEDLKPGDIPKPTLPSVLPKKPLPPKTSNSSSSSHPPRRPERPPTLASESPKTEGRSTTPDSAPDRSQDADMDLDAVVSSTDKLSHPTASRPRVTDRRPRSQIFSQSSLPSAELLEALDDRKDKDRGKEEPEPVTLRKTIPALSAADSKAPLPVKPSSLNPPNAVLRPVSPSSSSGLSPSPELRHSPLTPPSLEELRSQLRDLRASVEILKTQHRQEMKQLASSLDEEKRIRISLQMEVEHIKKSLLK